MPTPRPALTGPKLVAMILFGFLAFAVTFLFSIGLTSGRTASLSGLVTAGLTSAAILLADDNRRAFARGILGLGAVFVLVPLAVVAQWGEDLATGATGGLSDAERGEILAISVLFSAGLVFGLVAGGLLLLAGGLLHRRPARPTPGSPPGR